MKNLVHDLYIVHPDGTQEELVIPALDTPVRILAGCCIVQHVTEVAKDCTATMSICGNPNSFQWFGKLGMKKEV